MARVNARCTSRDSVNHQSDHEQPCSSSAGKRDVEKFHLSGRIVLAALKKGMLRSDVMMWKSCPAAELAERMGRGIYIQDLTLYFLMLLNQ